MSLKAPEGQGFPNMAKAFRAFERTKNAPTVNAIRRVLTSIRADAKTRIPADGLGRKIWGKKASGLNALLKRVAVRTSGDSFSGGLEVKGLAGLIEQGGRTTEHRISAWRGRVLARRAGPGAAFFVKGTGGAQKAIVTHPGGPVAKKTRALEAIEAARPQFVEQITRAVAEALEAAARA